MTSPSKNKQGTFEEAACGCWLPHSLGLYVLAAHECNKLSSDFVRFMCYNGAEWRGMELPKSDDTITLVNCPPPEDIPDPAPIPGSDDVVIPLGWTKEADRLEIGHALVDQMHCG